MRLKLINYLFLKEKACTQKDFFTPLKYENL